MPQNDHTWYALSGLDHDAERLLDETRKWILLNLSVMADDPAYCDMHKFVSRTPFPRRLMMEITREMNASGRVARIKAQNEGKWTTSEAPLPRVSISLYSWIEDADMWTLEDRLKAALIASANAGQEATGSEDAQPF